MVNYHTDLHCEVFPLYDSDENIADMKSAILLVMMLSTLFGFSWGGALISKRQSEPAKKQVATDICDRRYHSSK